MANMELPADLAAFDYDLHGMRYPPYTSRVSWPIPIPMEQHATRTAPHHRNANANNMKRSTTPLQSQAYQHSIHHLPQHQHQHQHQPQAHGYMPDWGTSQQQTAHFTYPLDGSFNRDAGFSQHFTDSYAMPFQTSPTDYMAEQYGSGLPLDASYLPLTSQLDSNIPFDYQDFSNDLFVSNALPHMSLPLQNLPNSPTDTALEVRSLSSSDNGWTSVEYQHQSLDGSYQDLQMGAIFNPEETLHGRTLSDSSYSDVDRQSRHSWGSAYIPQHAIGSPGSDTGNSSGLEFHSPYLSNHSTSPVIKQEEQPVRPSLVTPSMVKPLRIKTSSSPQRSPTSTGRVSPPGRRQSRKISNGKATKPTIRRQPPVVKVETEKRVGRRKGPLRPEQRKQASEIRKLGACIRCKFLKKTVSAPIIDIVSACSRSLSVTRESLVKVASLPTRVFGKYRAQESISKRLHIS